MTINHNNGNRTTPCGVPLNRNYCCRSILKHGENTYVWSELFKEFKRVYGSLDFGAKITTYFNRIRLNSKQMNYAKLIIICL